MNIISNASQKKLAQARACTHICAQINLRARKRTSNQAHSYKSIRVEKHTHSTHISRLLVLVNTHASTRALIGTGMYMHTCEYSTHVQTLTQSLFARVRTLTCTCTHKHLYTCVYTNTAKHKNYYTHIAHVHCNKYISYSCTQTST